jgi:ribosome-associated heat shock protein Hsp15
MTARGRAANRASSPCEGGATAGEGVRVDVWIWQARFCKTRAQACRLVESGCVRLTREGRQTRLEKPSRTVRLGDELVFVVGGRLAAIRVLALGARRGPPAEARMLYESLDGDLSPLGATLADDEPRHADAGGGKGPSPRH